VNKSFELDVMHWFIERRVPMKTYKTFLRGFRMLALAVPVILLGMSLPALAAGQARMDYQAQELRPETRLEKSIRHELIMLPYYTVFDNLEFRIEDNNTVVLSGQVVWAPLKDDAEHAVERVDGVNKVVNNIEILPLSPFDSTIRRREYYAIYNQVGFERYAIQAVPSIHIIVKNGNVTLVGVVDDEYDKNVVGLAARNVPNVFSVTNNLRILHQK
jgi:hyperosmotically inducible protein